MMRITRWIATVSGAAVAISCGSDSRNPMNATAADHRYWSLSLNHHAVTLATLAPYDTLTLVATPYTFTHTVVSTTAPTTFTSSDPSIVTVSAAGVLTAIQPGQGVTVIARRTIGALTLADTAIVNVNNVPLPPPVLASVSIHPASGDSTDVNAGSSKIVTPFVVDTKGDTLSNVAVHLWSSDSTTVSIDQFGNATGAYPGHATLYAEATAYGISRSDSLVFTVKQPFLSVIEVLSRTPTNSTTAQSYFSPGTTQVAVGGFVVWYNDSGQPVDVVFDDTAGVEAVPPAWDPGFQGFFGLDTPNNPNAAGNMPAFAPVDSTRGHDGSGTRIRWFPKAGTFSFHSALYNTTGKIVVPNQ